MVQPARSLNSETEASPSRWRQPRGGPPVRPTSYFERALVDLLGRPSLYLSPDMTIVDALAELRDARMSAALVVMDGLLVGLFDEASGIRKVRDAGATFGELRVSSVVSPISHLLDATDTIAYALRILQSEGANGSSVGHDGGEPLGTLNADDLSTWVGAQFPIPG